MFMANIMQELVFNFRGEDGKCIDIKRGNVGTLVFLDLLEKLSDSKEDFENVKNVIIQVWNELKSILITGGMVSFPPMEITPVPDNKLASDKSLEYFVKWHEKRYVIIQPNTIKKIYFKTLPGSLVFNIRDANLTDVNKFINLFGEYLELCLYESLEVKLLDMNKRNASRGVIRQLFFDLAEA